MADQKTRARYTEYGKNKVPATDKGMAAMNHKKLMRRNFLNRPGLSVVSPVAPNNITLHFLMMPAIRIEMQCSKSILNAYLNAAEQFN